MTAEILQKIWPEWKIEGKPLGKGSFGVVYKAVRRDHGVESYAAIKVISVPTDPAEVDSLRSEGLDMNATRTYLQGIVNDFVSEIQLMESLKGVQNIVSVEDYKVVEKTGEIGWDIYIRMELLTSFNAYICDKKLKEEEVIKLGCDICTALEICAKRNIIHRDIKPENIFINDFGDFKLGDFGIARKLENMTGGLSQKGTFNYMAPEVSDSSQYDARVDTYSLGIVLYRLLNDNRLPFLDTEKQLLNPNERRNAVDRRLRGEELPAPCDASPAMAELILRACAYDPNMRFASATEMKQALLSVANGTYQDIASNPDRTTSVRKAADSYDNTTSVRKAPAASNQKSAPTVNTFGSAPKKKSKMPAVIAAVLAVILLSGVGFLIVPKLLDGYESPDSSETSDETTSEMADYSELDEEQQIAFIINDAETLAADDDFEGALSTIQRGLAIYPESGELRDKAEEYTENLNTQIKRQALAEANALADSGDYLGALQTVTQALETVGNDGSLTEAAKTYEDAYAESISAQVDAYIAEQNITAAKQLLESALKELPNNSILNDQKAIVDEYKTIALDTLTPVDGGFIWNNGSPVDPLGNSYANASCFTILHGSSQRENIFQPSGDWREQDYLAEYSNPDCNLLKFRISPYEDSHEEATSYIQIFVDDELCYTSPTIGRKQEAIDLSLEITGSKAFAINVHVSGYGCLMLTDVVLEKLPEYNNTQYEKNDKSVSAAALDPFNGEISWQNDIATDIFNNDYTSAKNYTVFHGNSQRENIMQPDGHWRDEIYEAEYYVNKEYSSLNFDIAPYVDFGVSSTSYVKVYLDDVLVYSTPAITQKTAKFNTGSINVSEANYVKIVAEIGEFGCIIISNVCFELE